MNIEIKFRGKRINNGEWVYGYLSFNFNRADEYVPFISWKDDRYLWRYKRTRSRHRNNRTIYSDYTIKTEKKYTREI